MADPRLKSAGQGALAGAGMGAVAGPWGAAIGAVAGGAYGYFSGGDEERPTSDLYGPQKPYLMDIWSQAQDLYGQTKMPSEYENQLYDQAGAFYGPGGQGQQMADRINQLGQGYSGMGQSAMEQYLNAGPAKITYDYENVNQGINNQILQAQIDAATAGTYRDLREKQLTGTALAGAGMGNLGGSRGHQMEAILTRGALDTATNTAATMRGKAYDTAYSGELNRAIQQANLDAQRQSGLGQFGTNLAGMGLQAQQGAYGMYGNNMRTGLDIGKQRRMAPWESLQMYQQAIGSPMMVGMEQQPNAAMQGLAYGAQAVNVGMGAMAGQNAYDQQQTYNQNYMQGNNNQYGYGYGSPYGG